MSPFIFFTCSVIHTKLKQLSYLSWLLNLTPSRGHLNFFETSSKSYLGMFWCTKSKARHDKIKTQDFRIPGNCIFEKIVYLWTNIITFSGYFSWWGLCWFSDCQIRNWLHWIHCFARLRHKNTFLSDYSDYADFHEK